MMSNLKPLQGEIWLFDPDPVKGNEIGKKIRSAIIISNNFVNSGPSGLVFIVPLSSVDKGIESHVRIDRATGLSCVSFALCEQVRSISKNRLVKKLGKVASRDILKEIRSWILNLTHIHD